MVISSPRGQEGEGALVAQTSVCGGSLASAEHARASQDLMETHRLKSVLPNSFRRACFHYFAHYLLLLLASCSGRTTRRQRPSSEILRDAIPISRRQRSNYPRILRSRRSTLRRQGHLRANPPMKSPTGSLDLRSPADPIPARPALRVPRESIRRDRRVPPDPGESFLPSPDPLLKSKFPSFVPWQ